LPVKAIVAALRGAGVPAGLSLSAGSFVCNAVFFALLERLARRDGVRGGFAHLPLLPEQAAQHPGLPTLALATMVDGMRLALATALATREDLAAPGGSIA
jgi:pyroglutamyl-peptidase